MTDDPWDVLASLYDWEHADFDDDLGLYLGLARRTGGPILEAACGTGRILLPLAEAGFRLCGLDSSQGMLAAARARLALQPRVAEAVTLVHGDLRHARLEGAFGLSIVALDSFGLLVGQTDQIAALRTLRDHLRRGGLLVVDVANGNARAWEPREEVHHHFTRPHPDSGRPLTKWVLRSTDPASQVDELTYLYDRVDEDGRVVRTVIQHPLRYFHRFELTLLLERAGLIVEDVFGDYDSSPYVSDSPRLIAIARRPDDRE